MGGHRPKPMEGLGKSQTREPIPIPIEMFPYKEVIESNQKGPCHRNWPVCLHMYYLEGKYG